MAVLPSYTFFDIGLIKFLDIKIIWASFVNLYFLLAVIQDCVPIFFVFVDAYWSQRFDASIRAWDSNFLKRKRNLSAFDAVESEVAKSAVLHPSWVLSVATPLAVDLVDGKYHARQQEKANYHLLKQVSVRN